MLSRFYLCLTSITCNNIYSRVTHYTIIYFCCFYSIWSLFSFYVQLGPHFHQIVVNLFLFTISVYILNIFKQYMPRVSTCFFFNFFNFFNFFFTFFNFKIIVHESSHNCATCQCQCHVSVCGSTLFSFNLVPTFVIFVQFSPNFR